MRGASAAVREFWRRTPPCIEPRGVRWARGIATVMVAQMVVVHNNLRSDPMKFRPLHDRVVVRRLDAEEKTTGGIIIPDTAKEKPMEGEVIAVGPGARNEQGQLVPLDVKAGDRILFGKWSGTEVKIDGVEYLIMKESDIMGILEETHAKK